MLLSKGSDIQRFMSTRPPDYESRAISTGGTGVQLARTSSVSRKQSRRSGPAEPICSHMWIHQDRVSVRIHRDKAGRSRCALVRLLQELHPLCLQLALKLADVGERGELLSIAVPAGIEGENGI
jgi:hypothetical protein